MLARASRSSADPLGRRASTAFRGDAKGAWSIRRWGPQRQDIRAVAFPSSSDRDSPFLAEALGQIPGRERIGTVPADGAQDSRRRHAAIIDRQPTPILPICKSGRPWKGRPQSQETKPYAPLGAMVGHFGSAGPDTTSEAGSKQRCVASRRSVSASRQDIPTARPQKPGSASQG